MAEETKKCPYCGAEVPLEAKKCRYCGEWLVTQEKDKPKASFHCSAIIEGIIALIIVIAMFTTSFENAIIPIIILYLALHLYFLPSLIADKKRTQYTGAILALNLLLGLTVIVWIGCLVWAIALPDLSKNVTENKDRDNNKTSNYLNVIVDDFHKNFKPSPKAKDIPVEIQGKFNWGAFLLNWIWGIGNKSYQTLWCLIPFVGFVWTFVCGFKGNEWAWRNNKYSDIEKFNKVQKNWSIASIIIASILLLASLLTFVLFVNTSNNSTGQTYKNKTITAEDETTKIEKAVNVYHKEHYKEMAKQYGVSEKCYADYQKIIELEGEVAENNYPCSPKENQQIKSYLKRMEDEASNREYALDDVSEPLWTNGSMPKSLVLQDVPIMCFEKANMRDNSKCTEKQLNTIKEFYKNNHELDWEKEYFEY